MTPLQTALTAAGCEVAFDNLTRQLYATDASIYQIQPVAVAFPRNTTQTRTLIQAAAQHGVPVIPRGAGTGLVGGALGAGLILDLAKNNSQITNLNLDQRTVRVGAGVILDQLNNFLKPHGFCFGPDVATSSRATLGGMIANNSSGARVPVYGTTTDHIHSLEIVLADGRIETIGPDHPGLALERDGLRRLIQPQASLIRQSRPPGLLKRWPGYALERLLAQPDNLNHLLAGSEGTLAAILSADLKILPLPRQKGLGLLFFDSVAEAMQATVALLDLKPAAIEHIDRVLFDQTRGQLPFKPARDLLQLDAHPCEAILLVEFYEDVLQRLAALSKRNLGLRSLLLTSPEEMNLVWDLRKAGLSLLTGRKGSAKPTTGIEDVAVRPQQLPDYVAGLQSLLKSLDLHACFYGHAAAGLLHVRPVLDLHEPADLRKFRQLADDVSALVRQFKGSISAEHGVGMARTEYLADHTGPELLKLMREVKSLFDPTHHLNPGKLIDSGLFRIDTHLRQGAGHKLTLPFPPTLAFAAKDQSFIGNLEQCNGCGGCRKLTPTMCPTFLATGEELMSTRGRANLIRACLEGRLESEDADPLGSTELEAALSNCLACKACTKECPSNVNLALLKAELLHARHQRHGLLPRERLLGRVDLLSQAGCLLPRLANHALRWPWLRRLLSKHLDLSDQRPFPPYTTTRFDRWFKHHPTPPSARHKRVLLWDDTFVRYHDPHVGQAAVTVLEAAGFEVILPAGRRCCGRPAFSQGDLHRAARLGRHNLALLKRQPNLPILFLEPSCYAMFAEDYRELKLPDAESIATRCFLFEQFINDLCQREPDALPFQPRAETVAIHAHCHAKALLNPAFMEQLARRLPQRHVTLLNTGCCGMAGAFGALQSKYNLSRSVAQPLLDQIQAQPPGTLLIASGTSCRHQIEHLTPTRPLHMAELLARALPSSNQQPGQ